MLTDKKVLDLVGMNFSFMHLWSRICGGGCLRGRGALLADSCYAFMVKTNKPKLISKLVFFCDTKVIPTTHL